MQKLNTSDKAEDLALGATAAQGTSKNIKKTISKMVKESR